MSATESLAASLAAALQPLAWQERLTALRGYANLKIVMSTSFGFEDQALTHVVARESLPVQIFTLDTGRLFEETQTLHHQTRSTYNVAIDTYYPDASALQTYVAQNGINGFYDTVENRKSCCHIRKVEPLGRALRGVDIWISGLRRDQGDSRKNLGCAEWDAAHGVVKLYPLIDVGTDTLWDFIRANKVPYNPMHDRGFPSIGCAPCTRAIQAGEQERAGRWWWEQDGSQECGLHIVDGKLVRSKGAKMNA